LLYLNRGLLVTVALGYSTVLILLLKLVLPRVWALIGIMPWLPTIVANAGWKFFLAWRLVARPDGTENFPMAYAGMESLSNGPMRMIGTNHAHSS
jgi:hypothetical protein